MCEFTYVEKKAIELRLVHLVALHATECLDPAHMINSLVNISDNAGVERDSAMAMFQDLMMRRVMYKPDRYKELTKILCIISKNCAFMRVLTGISRTSYYDYKHDGMEFTLKFVNHPEYYEMGDKIIKYLNRINRKLLLTAEYVAPTMPDIEGGEELKCYEY